jgi:hypothetical protein
MGEFGKRLKAHSGALYALIAFAAFAIYLIKPNSAIFLTDDSPSYIYFNPGRPIGYPLLLALVKTLTGGYAWLPQIQLALTLVSIVAVAFAVRRLLGSALAGAFVLVFSAANVAAVSLAFTMMSDVFSLVMLGFFAASLIHFLVDGGLARSISKSLLAAAATTVRPVNVTLIVADLIAIAARGGATTRRKLLYAAIALVCAVAGVLASPVAYRVFFGTRDVGSPLARGVFQKAMYVEPINEAKYRDCVGDRAFESIQLVRTYTANAPEATQRFLAQTLSDTARFQYLIPLIANERHLVSGRQTDPYLTCYTLQAVREHPVQLIAGVWTEFWASETNRPFLDETALAQLKDYLAAHRPPLSELAPQRPPPQDLEEAARTEADFGAQPTGATTEADMAPARVRSALIVWPLRLFGILVFASPFIAVLLLAFSRAAPAVRLWLWAVVALSAISMIGRAVSAVVEFALTRYTAVYWPIDVAVVTIFVFAVAALARGEDPAPMRRAGGDDQARSPREREERAAATVRDAFDPSRNRAVAGRSK